MVLAMLRAVPQLEPLPIAGERVFWGDGVHDDTKAIQRAIDIARGHTGVVYFPPGTYRISQPISVTSGITFMGAGADRTIFMG
jgi:hypothetical protein